MRKNITLLAALTLTIISVTPASSQAFRKGAFILNVSEGSTGGTFSTYSTGEYPHSIGEGYQGGTRDPFCIEYGLSNRIGIGLSSGTDFYMVNALKYYEFGLPGNTIKATTSEFTIDCHYHFYVTPKMDFALVASFGGSSVGAKGSLGDQSYQYMSKGSIARLGLHSRLYFSNHFGFLAIASIFTMSNSSTGISGNSVGQGVTTGIMGEAIEFGLCYRIRK